MTSWRRDLYSLGLGLRQVGQAGSGMLPLLLRNSVTKCRFVNIVFEWYHLCLLHFHLSRKLGPEKLSLYLSPSLPLPLILSPSPPTGIFTKLQKIK